MKNAGLLTFQSAADSMFKTHFQDDSDSSLCVMTNSSLVEGGSFCSNSSGGKMQCCLHCSWIF